MQDQGPGEIQRQGQAMSAAAQGLGAIAADIGERHAYATAKEGLNQYSAWADKQDIDYRSQLGARASEVDGKRVQPGDAPARIIQNHDAEIRRIVESLPSERARELFQQHAERARVHYEGRLVTHEVRQIQIHDRAQDEATRERFTQSYAISGDPAAFQGAVDAAEEMAHSDGLSPEARDQWLLETKTDLHVGYIAGLLTEQDASAADEYLREIPRDGIGAAARQKLRAKIDRVLQAKKIEKMAVDLVLANGYAGGKDSRKDIPSKTMRRLEWQQTLNDPGALAAIGREQLTLDEEVIQSRLPGQAPAGAGTLSRSLAVLEDRYRKGEIDASELREAQAMVVQQVRLVTAARDQEATDALQELEQVLHQERAAGRPTSFDSPTLQAKYPNLVDRIWNTGMVSAAREVTETVNQRVTDPAYREDYYVRDATGELGRMTRAGIYARYGARLNRTDYLDMERRWVAAQPDPDAAQTKITNDPLMGKYDVIRRFLDERDVLTGKRDKVGIREARNEDERKTYGDTLFALSRRLKGRGEITDDDVLAELKALQEATVHIERDPSLALSLVTLGMAGGSVEEVRELDAMAEIRRAEAEGDTERAEELRERFSAQRVELTDGTLVRTVDGKQAIETKAGEPIPTDFTAWIREGWRLRAYGQQVGTGSKAYKAVKAGLEKAGALANPFGSPQPPINFTKTAEVWGDRRRADGSFWVSAWPTVEDQITAWETMRPRVPPPAPMDIVEAVERFNPIPGGIDANIRIQEREAARRR